MLHIETEITYKCVKESIRTSPFPGNIKYIPPEITNMDFEVYILDFFLHTNISISVYHSAYDAIGPCKLETKCISPRKE